MSNSASPPHAELSSHLFEQPASPSTLSGVNVALAGQYPGTAAPSSSTLQYELAFQSRYDLYFLQNDTCPPNVTQALALGRSLAAPLYNQYGISNPQGALPP
jgi:hypothetical protein